MDGIESDAYNLNAGVKAQKITRKVRKFIYFPENRLSKLTSIIYNNNLYASVFYFLWLELYLTYKMHPNDLIKYFFKVHGN